MFTCELIAGTGANAVTLDLKTDIPISLNYEIADARNPDKRSGSFSKTIQLAGSNTNDRFFEHHYHVNIVSNSFNPNVKTPCLLYADNQVVIKGDLQLKKIIKVVQNGESSVIYEVVIYSNLSNLFQSIGDYKLTDLDLSAYNHALTATNIVNSWSAPKGVGYMYPLIDYGYNGFATNYFHVEHFRPAIYAKTYWDAIFSDAGKTYTSNFLNSTLFKSLIIPNNDERLNLSSAVIPNYQFYAGNNNTASTNTSLTSFGASGWGTVHFTTSYITTSSTLFYKPNDDSSAAPFSDPGNIYNTSTGVFTVPIQGLYSITGNLAFEMKANFPATAVSASSSPLRFEVLLQKSVNSGASWTVLQNWFYYPGSGSITTSYQSYSYSLASSPFVLNAGEQYRVSINQNSPIFFLDGGSSPVTTGTASIDLRMTTSSTLVAKLVDTKILEGNTVEISTAIPKDVKQRDFLMAFVKMFNLYITEDKSNLDNYIIEPRDDFYANGVIKDWTEKLSVGPETPVEVAPMGDLDSRDYIWRYKDEKADYYNKQYSEKYQEPYGTKKETILNDFLTGQSITEVIFSPTPIVDNPNNSMIIPKIFSYDGTNVKPVKHNIRVLYYSGIQSSGNSWTLGSGTGNQTKTTYPFCAMVDNALTPSLSIEFGIPNEIYYDDISTTYTTNNLYNRYHSKFLTEISDPDSKLVTAWLYLEPKDIFQFSFFDTIYLDDAYYLVNKIQDYNALKKSLTKVEFLKLKTADEFVSSSISITDLGGNIGATVGTARFGNTAHSSIEGESNNFLAGDNISSRSVGSVATGRNISIGNDTYNVNIISCTDVIVGDNASGITLTNCSGITIAPGVSGINLMNCYNVSITDGTYDYVAVGVSSYDVPPSDSSTGRMGITFTFNDGSSH